MFVNEYVGTAIPQKLSLWEVHHTMIVLTSTFFGGLIACIAAAWIILWALEKMGFDLNG